MKTSSSVGTIARTLAPARPAARERRAISSALVGFAIDADVQAIAEQLDALAPEARAQHLQRLPRRRGDDLQNRRRSSRPARFAGSSSASSRPSLTSATRAHRSASSRYGVAITIVRPCDEELGEQLPELAPRHRIDAGRRLVEHEHRAARARACTRARASASSRPTADRRAGRGTARSPVSSSSRVRRAAKSRTPWISREERDVLVDRQIAVEAEALREIADRRGRRAAIAKRIDAKHRARARRPARAARRSAAASSSCRRRPDR